MQTAKVGIGLEGTGYRLLKPCTTNSNDNNINSNSNSNTNTSKFDWIPVVLTGLVFFALSAWIEFFFYNLRYSNDTNDTNDTESTNDNDFVGSENSNILAGAPNIPGLSNVASSPHLQPHLQPQPHPHAIVQTRIPTPKRISLPKMLQSKVKPQQLKQNRLLYALSVTIITIFAIGAYNHFQNQRQK